jgi:putative phage-type endonuclease
MLVNLVQRTPEWHAWRNEGLTASEIAVVLGLSPDKTAWRLWSEKTGRLPREDLSANPYVRAGVINEPRLRAYLETKYATMIVPGCYEYDDDPRLRASLDGLSLDDVVYELKWPGPATWTDVAIRGTRADAFRLYQPQVQMQLLCTNCQRGKLVFGREGEAGIETIEFDIVADAAFHAEIMRQGDAFLACLASDKPPVKDRSKDPFVPVGMKERAWAERARKLRDLESRVVAKRAELDDLESEKAQLVEPLLEMMGEYFVADHDGVAITRYRQDGSVDYRGIVKERLALDDAELDAYRGASSMRKRIRVTPEAQADDGGEERVVSDYF